MNLSPHSSAAFRHKLDMHFFGMLKAEFYQKYETLFKLPGDMNDEDGKGKVEVRD